MSFNAALNQTNPCPSITPSLWSVVVRGLAPDVGTTSPPATSTPAMSTPGEQKSALHFSVTVGIIVAVGVFFVAVGAFLVGKKRLRISVSRVG